MVLVQGKRPCVASYVRVPSNGTEAQAKAILCNLGCVSDLAARVPVAWTVFRANTGPGGEQGRSRHHQVIQGATYITIPNVTNIIINLFILNTLQKKVF